MKILVKPVFPVIKRLSMNNVHKSLHELHLLQQEVEMGEYQLGVPGGGGEGGDSNKN